MRVTKAGDLTFSHDSQSFDVNGWEIDGHKLMEGNPGPELVAARIGLCLDWIKWKVTLQMTETKGSA